MEFSELWQNNQFNEGDTWSKRALLRRLPTRMVSGEMSEGGAELQSQENR